MPHETAADPARQDPSDGKAAGFLPGATSGRLPEDKMELKRLPGTRSQRPRKTGSPSEPAADRGSSGRAFPMLGMAQHGNERGPRRVGRRALNACFQTHLRRPFALTMPAILRPFPVTACRLNSATPGDWPALPNMRKMGPGGGALTQIRPAPGPPRWPVEPDLARTRRG